MKQHDFQLVTNINKQSNFELIHNIFLATDQYPDFKEC